MVVLGKSSCKHSRFSGRFARPCRNLLKIGVRQLIDFATRSEAALGKPCGEFRV